MTSLFPCLKSSTEQDHREIEAIIDPMKNFSSMGDYKEHVWKTWTLYRSLEADLRPLDWVSVNIDFESRRKTRLLEEDMHFLAISRVAVGTISASSLGPLSLDFAIGCLYVLEGATWGGQVISRHLSKMGIGPATGGLFFNGYGAKTGEMWASFQKNASEYCVTEDQVQMAVRGAKATFGKFRDVMLGEAASAHGA